MKTQSVFLKSFALIAISFLAFCCSPNDSEQLDIVELPDQVQIESGRFDEFADRINGYANALEAKQQSQLQSYIHSVESKLRAENGRTREVTCECRQGQTHCSASSWASECCICCSNGVSAVCGVYWFVAACRCGDVEEDGGRIGSQQERYTTFYPKRFNDALVYAKGNGINVKEIEAEFKTLMNAL